MSGNDERESPEDLLAAAYALDGPAANRQLYARWAGTYDSGFVADSGYRYHERVAGIFAELLAADVGPVVDVGCGTGLAGVSLRQLCDAVIDGIDISPEMLRQAAAKEHRGGAVYRHLIEADLTQTLAIADAAYAGAMSTGTFTHGHVGPGALAEVVRITQPGGCAALGINAAHFRQAGFEAAIRALLDTGRITALRLIDVPIYADVETDDPDTFAHVATFTVR